MADSQLQTLLHPVRDYVYLDSIDLGRGHDFFSRVAALIG